MQHVHRRTARHRRAICVTAAAAAVVSCTLASSAQTFIGRNFLGSTRGPDSTLSPPDTMGAVGVDHFVELINGRYSVYRKSDGARVQTSTLDSFWAAAGAPHVGSFSFDPRVLYDAHNRRWFALSVDNARGPNSFLVAISNSSDPTQGWSGFKIDADANNTHWADFPMMGMNGDSLVLSANMFPIVSGSQNQQFVVIPKQDLLQNVPTVAGATIFNDVSASSSGFSPQPVFDQDNSSLPLPILSRFSSTGLKRSNIVGSPQSPLLIIEPGTVAVPSHASAPNADQPGPKAHINVGDTRFSGNVILNNGEFWAAHTVNVSNRAAIRWYRIDAATDTLIESGTVAHPTLAFFYPSIAVNDLGDVVMGFSGTDPSTFVSTYAVAGKTTGGVTTFGNPFQTKAGQNDYERLDASGRNRWGDYSATTVDPADPSIFWTIQEFVSATDQWSTQVTEVIVPQAGEVRWRNPSDGDWTNGSSWFGGAVPNSTSHVIFSRATHPGGGSYTPLLSVDASAAVDRLSVRQGNVVLDLGLNTLFLNSSTIDQASLIVGEFGGSPHLTITNGTLRNHHTLLARQANSIATVTLSNATWISQGVLWLGGDPTSGGGTATLAIGPGSSLSLGGVKVRPAGLLTSQATIGVGSLDMEGGRVEMMPNGANVLKTEGFFFSQNDGVIELHDNAILIDWLFTSPLNVVRDRIVQAYAGGAWIDAGITSSEADASNFGIGYAEASELFTNFPAQFLGEEVDNTSLLVRFVRYGDADLSGNVNLSDFNRLAANFGTFGALWDDGDFNYDALVNLLDFNLLAANFGLTASPDGPTPEDWAALAAVVPEPGTGIVVAIGAVSAILRRRQRRICPA